MSINLSVTQTIVFLQVLQILRNDRNKFTRKKIYELYIDHKIDNIESLDKQTKLLIDQLNGDFDEIGFKFFNDDGTVGGSGGPDESTRPSEAIGEFIELEYTAGVTDDGIGTALEEFIAFQIKIVMRTTNQAQPPMIKQLRVLALAT